MEDLEVALSWAASLPEEQQRGLLQGEEDENCDDLPPARRERLLLRFAEYHAAKNAEAAKAKAKADLGSLVKYAGRLEELQTVCCVCRGELLRRVGRACAWDTPELHQLLVELGIYQPPCNDSGNSSSQQQSLWAMDLMAVVAAAPAALAEEGKLEILTRPKMWWQGVGAVKKRLAESESAAAAESGKPPGGEHSRVTTSRASAAGRFWAAKFWRGVAGRYTRADLLQERPVDADENFLPDLAESYMSARHCPFLVTSLPPGGCVCHHNDYTFKRIMDSGDNPYIQVYSLAEAFFVPEVAERLVHDYVCDKPSGTKGASGDDGDDEWHKLHAAFVHFDRVWRNERVRSDLAVLRTLFARDYLESHRNKPVSEAKVEENSKCSLM